MELNHYIKRAQKGDRNAFGRLKQIYRPEAVFLAARFILDRKEAEEVAEAVFKDAFEKLARLKEPELFERWLWWCVARECRERFRERVPALFTEREDRSGRDPAAGIPKKGERIPPKKRELIEQLVQAVDDLPVLQRFPFVYCRLCGYSIEETAAFMGLKEATVFFRVRSGEAALYEAIRGTKAAHAGLEDIVLALRAYPERYLRPEEEDIEKMPVPEENGVRAGDTTEGDLSEDFLSEDDLPEGELFEADPLESDGEEPLFEEEAEAAEKRSPVLPVLIAISALLLAALLFFVIWKIRDDRARKNAVPVEASFTVQAPTAEPGKTDVTAVPRSAFTPVPTATPAPTFTPGPTAVPPDTSELEYLPEGAEWFSKIYPAVACVQGSMNVRKGPGTGYKNLGTLSAGQEVLVYGVKDSWYIVEFLPGETGRPGEDGRAGKLGWASGQYLFGLPMFSDRSNDNLAGITPPSGAVSGAEVKKIGAFEGARLYRDPSENATYIVNSEFGTEICVLSFEGDWVFVNDHGKFGWMKKLAFDASNAMDVSSGTYFYTVSEYAVIEDTGSLVKTDATLCRQEYITQANLEKYLLGETAKTKHGTKLKPAFTYADKSPEEAEPGVAREIVIDDGALRFVYDTEEKLYALYTGLEPKLYSVKKVTLMIRPDAVIKDDRFISAFGRAWPSYGTVNTAGTFVTDGRQLDEYVEEIKELGEYGEFSGTVTVRNGAVCELTIAGQE